MVRAVAIVLALVAIALAAWFASEAAHPPIVEPAVRASRSVAGAETRDESHGDAAKPTRVETATSASESFPTITIFGRVLDAATKAPIANARIEVDTDLISDRRRPSCVSAPDGTYRSEALEASSHATLIVRVEGCLPFEESVAYDAPGTHEHDILVEFGLTVRGRVIDAMTRAPIEGAGVRLKILDDEVALTTNADGSFVVRGISRHGFAPSITTRSPGYLGCEANLDSKQLFERELVLPMIPECTIEGTVLDADGKPVPNAIVRRKLRRCDDDWREQLGVVADPCVAMKPMETRFYPDTDAAGHFRIDGLGPWCEYAVWVTIGNHRLSETVRFDRPNESQVIVLRPKQGSATITGTITVDGKAVADCGFEWTTADNQTRVHVNADGSYFAEHVVAGIVEIEATYTFGGGKLPTVLRRATLDVHDGDTIRQDFALRFDRTRIDGIALDDAERPVAALNLQAVRSDPGARVVTVTDETGRFVFELPDALGGDWSIYPADAEWKDYRAGGFVAGSSGATVHLQRAK